MYGLCDPDTGAIRYIGKAQSSEERLKRHLRDARRRSTPVYRWIRRLSAAEKLPLMVVIAAVPSNLWEDAERDVIANARKIGLNLLNVAEGGNAPKGSAVASRINGLKTARNPENYVWRLSKRLGQAEQQSTNLETRKRLAGIGTLFSDAVKQHKKAGTLDALNAKIKALFARKGWEGQTAHAA